MNEDQKPIWFDKFEFSAVITITGVVILFALAIIVTLWAPRFIDPSWTTPTSYYQVQMYEVADPNLFISSSATGGDVLQFVHRLKNRYTILSFEETRTVRIIAPPDLEHFITRYGQKERKLTSRLLMLRQPQKTEGFDAERQAEEMRSRLRESEGPQISYRIFELYDPKVEEAFSVAHTDGVEERFVDSDFLFLDPNPNVPYHSDPGFVYVNNPQEYRISPLRIRDKTGWQYHPDGKRVIDLEELEGKELGFLSRKTLIELGEHIFAIEGCWYCHTDQTRTLVQDVVLNGSDSFPAPPSSPNEYIYQRVTFPGTRRIGPDLSRVAIKRPGRDWHKSHFWSPQTASKGSIMPAFRHFFDADPAGTSRSQIGVPNYQFEAIFQYLMTKGSRITPPSQAWWLGRDPVQTKEIIELRR